MDQLEVLLQDWPGCEPSMSQCPLHSFAVCIPLLHADRTPFLYLLHPKLCMELPRFSTSYFFEPRPTHEASGLQAVEASGLQAVEYHAAYTGRIWHTDTHSILWWKSLIIALGLGLDLMILLCAWMVRLRWGEKHNKRSTRDGSFSDNNLSINDFQAPSSLFGALCELEKLGVSSVGNWPGQCGDEFLAASIYQPTGLILAGMESTQQSHPTHQISGLGKQWVNVG